MNCLSSDKIADWIIPRLLVISFVIGTIVICLFFQGCTSTSVYVLDQAELVKIKSGDIVTAKYDGWLLSQRAVDRVMNAKIKGVNLQ